MESITSPSAMGTAEFINYYTDILLKTVSFEVLLIRDSMFFQVRHHLVFDI